MLFNGRNDAIKFIDYSSMILETKRILKTWREKKILNPKQMPQRLPIALAQVKAGNDSENCLLSVSIKRN